MKAAAGLQFSIHGHAIPDADHTWAPADMKAAAGLLFVINVHAVPLLTTHDPH